MRTTFFPFLLRILACISCTLTLAGCLTLSDFSTQDAQDGPKPVRSDKSLKQIEVADLVYANEATNHGTPPVSALLPVTYSEPTPINIAGGKMISTVQLHQKLTSKKPPLLINALGGDRTELIPGSVWLSGSGMHGHFNDDTQKKLGKHLKALTKGNKKRALVFYCTSYDCWRSYNAALRAVNLRYRNVHWYRGGLSAWYEARLPSESTHNDQW